MKTDTTSICRWVAEELLGWKNLEYREGGSQISETGQQLSWPSGYYGDGPSGECYFGELSQLQSWHGIGLVIEAMSKRSEEEWTRFNDILKDVGLGDPYWWEDGEPWEIVYPAAQRAVEEEKRDA